MVVCDDGELRPSPVSVVGFSSSSSGNAYFLVKSSGIFVEDSSTKHLSSGRTPVFAQTKNFAEEIVAKKIKILGGGE